MNELHGRKRQDSRRRQSYADIESYKNADVNGKEASDDEMTDDENDPLLTRNKKRNTFPFEVRFLKWQESSVGNYIEFKIRIRFLECEQEERPPFSNDVDQEPTGKAEWDIYKRYSDFVTLNDLLMPFVRAKG